MTTINKGPFPKDRAAAPVPRPGAPRAAVAQPPRPVAPDARASAPAPRAPLPAVSRAHMAVPTEAPRRRGAPTAADKEAARIAKEQAEYDEVAAATEAEAPAPEETEIVEGQEGEIPVDENGGTLPYPEAEEEVLEAEIEPVRAPNPPPRAAAPKPAAPARNINPAPTPATRRPAAPAPKPPETDYEHRASAGGNVRPGKDLARKSHTTAVQTAAAAAAAKPKSSALQGDVTIPRLLLMQGSSQLVKDRKAQVGDIVRSGNGERLGGSNGPDSPADPVDIIPLALSQSWTIMSGDGKTFIGTEPRTPANDSDPWEFEGEDGQTYKRLKTIDAIVMVASDIERLASGGGVAVDEDGVPLDLDSSVILPHAVSFKSTGFAAGKGISTFFARVEAVMKSHPMTRPYHFTLPLSCYSEADEDNEWHVYDVGSSKRTAANLIQEARNWYDVVNTRQVVIQDEVTAEQNADAAIATPEPAKKPTAGKRQSQF